jgi:mycothiol synthase
MNFSVMTTSFPIDDITYDEIKQLCDSSYEIDGVHYDAILNLPVATDYNAKGFLVLVYNDSDDALVAVASAIDLMGFNTFEWTMLVQPMYRNIGLGTSLYHALQKEMVKREAAGQLALMMQDNKGYGSTFLQRKGFSYSFSEVTLEAKAEHRTWENHISIRSFMSTDTAKLIQVFCEAFGDEEAEALDLIEYNSTHEELLMWVAEVSGEVVGTVTTRKEGFSQWITALAVHPKAEGQGVGSALINSVKKLAQTQGELYVKLDVELENDRALAIYNKTGFIKVAQIDYFALSN